VKVLILGAGVAGVTAAWHFWQDGHEVTVLERNPGVALETSFANGGQLSYSYVAPLASPSVIPKIPPWLLRRDSPLRFRPEIDPDQWRWCLAFLAACNRGTADLTTERLLRLSFYSRDLMRSLMKSHALDFDYVQNGKLVVHTDTDAFESARRLMDFQRSLGCEQSALDPSQCVEIEPALEMFHQTGASRPRRPRMAGAIYTPSEDAGDCYKFCNELKRLMTAGANPVTFRFDIGVDRLLASKGRLMGAETNAGVFEADAYVLSLGTSTPYLLKPLGIRVPVYPLKGYSLTLPVADEHKAPKISVTDFKRKVVYATIGGELRVAGMADLSGRQARIDVERVDQLVTEVKTAFPGASDYREISPWCGMRPATPKGAPVLGRTPYANLWLNSGHGALGFTLGLATGRVVADLVGGKTPAVPLDGFTLDAQ